MSTLCPCIYECVLLPFLDSGEISKKDFGRLQPEPTCVPAVPGHAAGRTGEPRPWWSLWLHVSLQRRKWTGGGQGRQLSTLCGWQVRLKHIPKILKPSHLSRLNGNYLISVHIGHLVSESSIHPMDFFHRCYCSVLCSYGDPSDVSSRTSKQCTVTFGCRIKWKKKQIKSL